jgi:hypothetical protein
MDSVHPCYQPSPCLQKVLDEISRAGNPLEGITKANVDERREFVNGAARTVLADIPVDSVEDIRIPGDGAEIPARIYTPAGEWHSHPDGHGSDPSDDDLAAHRTIGG